MGEQQKDGGAQKFRSAFGDKLRAYLKEVKVTQRGLADESGAVDHSTISRLERGKAEPTLRTAVELADALKLSDAESLLFLRSGALRGGLENTVQTDEDKLLAKLRAIEDPIGQIPEPRKRQLLADMAENDRRRIAGLDSAGELIVE